MKSRKDLSGFASVILACIMCSLIACKPSGRFDESSLIGNWDMVVPMRLDTSEGEIPKPIKTLYEPFRYILREGGRCECRPGFYGRNNTKEGCEKRQWLGFESRWELRGDSLAIFEPGDSAWRISVIERLTRDSLILNWGASHPTIMLKAKEGVSDPVRWDEIVWTIEYPTGAMAYYHLDTRGRATRLGFPCSEAAELYFAQMSREQLEAIQAEWNRPGVFMQPHETRLIWTRGITTITFLDKGKITNQLELEGLDTSAPSMIAASTLTDALGSLEWARVTDSLRLKPLCLEQVHAESRNFTIDPSLSFWLSLRLQQGNVVRSYPDLPYKIFSSLILEGRQPVAYTNGRFFHIRHHDGTPICIDIGKSFFDIYSDGVPWGAEEAPAITKEAAY